MDDSCAVCAENLEWVAYGECGHREVCSTCVARLRFICGDRRCCICKTECSIVFVTKALGDYTRVFSDFSYFSMGIPEGHLGSLWHHEDTQALFDDGDHFKTIEAMCRLSCSVCDLDEKSNDGPKRSLRFNNIGQLKGHLFHRHKLQMCSLCLEARKVFICEQKLYTRVQMHQHIHTGDSEVDGSESERGGFMGHPICEFCKSPFYGENELYRHMSVEHFKCHICQRQHPGQNEYYKNYDHLEIHFRGEHHLCEDEACLAEKFIVFSNEEEMKRHTAMKHGGRMSRSKRNFVLQIPTGFHYHQISDQDNRHGRREAFRRETAVDNDLSRAIEASIETDIADRTFHEQSLSTQLPPTIGIRNDIDPIMHSFEALSTTDTDSTSRYHHMVNSSMIPMGESSFPPLSMAPRSNQQTHSQEGSLNNTTAARLRRKRNGKRNVQNTAPVWPATTNRPVPQPVISTQHRPVQQPVISTQHRPVTTAVPSTNMSAASHSTVTRPAVSNYAISAQTLVSARPTGHGHGSTGTPWNTAGRTGRVAHDAAAPHLVASRLLEPSVSDFPHVSATQTPKTPSNPQSNLNVEDFPRANKSLVENIRSALEHDKGKSASFKDISQKYRQGAIDTRRYLDFVRQYGLSHLVVEIARLCPDPQKQKELVETYNASLKSHALQGSGSAQSSSPLVVDGGSSRKGIGKSVLVGSTSKNTSVINIMNSVRKLLKEEVEVLSKDAYRGKSKVTVESSHATQPVVKLGENGSSSAGGGGGLGKGSGGSKQRKKTSKFLRVRLGDSSMASLDVKELDSDPDPQEESNGKLNSTTAPGLGVWGKGGVKKLFS